MAARWTGPESDATPVVLGFDFYEARHVFAVPPAYVRPAERLVAWLARHLPDEVANRSLHRIALPISAWISGDPRYISRPALDPNRRERVTVHVAERARHEAWSAWIDRGIAGRQVSDWEPVAAGNDELCDAISTGLLTALENPVGPRGPTVPAAHMVLAATDVPDDFLPFSKRCGTVDPVQDHTWCSYVAIYRAQSTQAMIVSQALVFWEGYDVGEYVSGMVAVRRQFKDKELSGGSAFGDESHYYEGTLPDDGMYGYTAFWRYANIYCEIWVGGPPGRFGPIDVYRYAEIQHRRAKAELESGRATASR